MCIKGLGEFPGPCKTTIDVDYIWSNMFDKPHHVIKVYPNPGWIKWQDHAIAGVWWHCGGSRLLPILAQQEQCFVYGVCAQVMIEERVTIMAAAPETVGSSPSRSADLQQREKLVG